jgi:hypothetical protein
MSVGSQPSLAGLNQALTTLALSLRNDCQAILNLQQYATALGLTGLEALGFSSEDAQTFINYVSYLNTVAEVYNGTGTQATAFDFGNAVCEVWAGQ